MFFKKVFQTLDNRKLRTMIAERKERNEVNPTTPKLSSWRQFLYYGTGGNPNKAWKIVVLKKRDHSSKSCEFFFFASNT